MGINRSPEALRVVGRDVSRRQATGRSDVENTHFAAPIDSNGMLPAVLPKTASECIRPIMVYDKKVYDFGTITPRSKHRAVFHFKNTGTDILRFVGKIKSTCGCTAPKLDKTEYAPGESGVIKVDYTAGKITPAVRRSITVHTNDNDNPVVRSVMTARIMEMVSFEPGKLILRPDQDNAGCPPIRVYSVDKQPFSVLRGISNQHNITVKVAREEKFIERFIQPRVNTNALKARSGGFLVLQVDHPLCKEVRIPYYVQSEYEFSPRSLHLMNGEPNQPTIRTMTLSNQYGNDFEISSISSGQFDVTLVGTEKIANQDMGSIQYRMRISIKPPATRDLKRMLVGVIKVHLSNETILSMQCTYTVRNFNRSRVPSAPARSRRPRTERSTSRVP